MTAKEILAKLVSFDVLSKQNNLSIANWISDYINQYGVETVYVYNEEKTQASLHCRIGPAVDGGIILSGHTDVVPVKGQPWNTNPFELIEKEGNLYGRGACDMKGYIACFLSVLPQMVKANLSVPIYFAISYDEEIGCLRAPELAEHIKSYYTEKPKYAIIGEPSMMQPIVGQKGILYVETKVNGSQGHSSRIEKEVSAIHESTRLILWLENKMKELSQQSRNESFLPPHSTMHVGQIKGGIATNVVAGNTTFQWDVRSIPEDSIMDIVNDYQEYCSELQKEKRKLFPEFKIENTLLHPPVPGLQTSEEASIVKLIAEVTGNAKPSYVAYATEAGQFAEAGFESIICGPGSIEQAHRANEFVSIEQLNLGVQMIENIIKKISL
ncbi:MULTISPECIES: acetylornithine deacetylase [unclassified Tenacibaculum]|uniref:acetylornithine deacetylase n=1 Tax=unclassified Tenacibaculum TaxID=2635139 RepID=UPI001F264001|nr:MULTISPECIES: acetylornithine deacetylase [unclassified Tenacibaculum]MCF2876397.1 acetylornithine deacetylase [Tenacibaculum sp. Cn5-1]MCF2936460.1 acetylornithine deacetylase [Tenacibaculum sp. Cn5-34]MCG7512815.1 acetylornithine deacetylase [Tenacibaculum sp. Cn5-46]